MSKKQAADDHNYQRWLRLNAQPKRPLTLGGLRARNRARNKARAFIAMATALSIPPTYWSNL